MRSKVIFCLWLMQLHVNTEQLKPAWPLSQLSGVSIQGSTAVGGRRSQWGVFALFTVCVAFKPWQKYVRLSRTRRNNASLCCQRTSFSRSRQHALLLLFHQSLSAWFSRLALLAFVADKNSTNKMSSKGEYRQQQQQKIKDVREMYFVIL